MKPANACVQTARIALIYSDFNDVNLSWTLKQSMKLNVAVNELRRSSDWRGYCQPFGRLFFRTEVLIS